MATWGGVDPNSSWTGISARADLERRLGRGLSDQDVADARRLTGYDDPTGNAAMTGAQYNTLLQEAAKRTGGSFQQWGGSSSGTTTSGPAFTVEDAPGYARRDYTPNEPYRAPTVEEMQVDPGYQFRLQQGQKAIENSAAARGMLRGTNTIRGVTDYAQNAASQEYQNVYNRARDTWGLNNDERRYAYGQAVAQDQLEYAPKLMTWQAKNAANMRSGELGFDRDWQREIYNRDDAWRRYTYGTDDEYRRWLENNNNRRFLVGQGNY